jgi:C4-dicarboxylate-specific signal transduction histidine kinase
MNNENTCREDSAALPRVLASSEQHNQVTDFAAQRLATSEVLRAIIRSPHDLQPILQTIVDSAVQLCRADGCIFRVVEETGFRLVAYKMNSPMLEGYSPPMFRERGTFIGRLYESKSPVHIPDFDAEIHVAGETDQLAVEKKHGLRTFLIVPMLRSDELIGSLSLARLRVEPFTEKEIELITDFAAEAAIALEITRRERQLRELQRELAHANRVVTLEQLTASITHEVNQPVGAARNNVIAALHFLDRNPPDLQEVREALAGAAKDIDRVSAIVSRMRALMQKASPRSERVDINEAVHEVIELTRGEAHKNGVSVKAEFAKGLPIITGDRVQLQQVVLNLILNALQAMAGDREGARQVLITTSQTESNDLCIGVRDAGPGLSSETLSRLFEPFYTTKPNGMGLGLAICRSIIEAHGGRLWATGCQPHGAAFQFIIPARPA